MSLDEDIQSSVEARSSPDSVASLPQVTEDKVDLLGLGQLFRRVCSGRHDDLEPGLLTDLLQVTLHGTSLSEVTASQLSEIIDARSRACLQLLPEFRALSPRDQAAILAHNLPLIHRFRQALCLHTMSWSELIREIIGEEKIRQEEENLPTDLSGSPKKTLAYKDLFTFPWCQSTEVETIHKTMMEDIASWVDVKDEVQLILLALILAFNHDFLDLEGRGQVEKIQLKYVILLQTHLRTKYPTTVAASKLTKAVKVYRGVNGGVLPDCFRFENKYGVRGGVEAAGRQGGEGGPRIRLGGTHGNGNWPESPGCSTFSRPGRYR